MSAINQTGESTREFSDYDMSIPETGRRSYINFTTEYNKFGHYSENEFYANPHGDKYPTEWTSTTEPDKIKYSINENLKKLLNDRNSLHSSLAQINNTTLPQGWVAMTSPHGPLVVTPSGVCISLEDFRNLAAQYAS